MPEQRPTGTNVKLVIAALICVILLILVGEPHDRSTISIDPKELAYLVQNELDHVPALTLAQWIAVDKKKIRLLDVRDKSEYDTYHIPPAENTSLISIADAHFDRNDTIVLYSQGGVHAAQALFILWARGYKHSFMLKGGLNEWNDDVLSPKLSGPATGHARDSLDAVARLSKYFGGAPTAAPPRTKSLPTLPPKEREKSRDEC